METQAPGGAELPVLPLKSTVVYPHGVATLQVGRTGDITMLEKYPDADARIVIACSKAPDAEEMKARDLGRIAVKARILDRLKLPGSSLQITVQGLERVELLEMVQEEPWILARIGGAPAGVDDPFKANVLVQKAITLYERLLKGEAGHPTELLQVLKMNVEEPGRFADLLAGALRFDYAEKLRVLQAVPVEQRLKRVIELLRSEIDRVRVAHEVERRAKGDMEESRREYFLRQQMRTIQRELGDEELARKESDEYQERLEALELDEAITKEAQREIQRLKHIQPGASEYQVIKTWLDRFLALPWKTFTEEKIELERVQTTLDDGHFGLERVKERVVEFLAVRKLNPEHKGPILCFAGPPGVGKTSLGKAIAEAIGRSFFRISVGGVHDEAEIRGHRRTYVGAMPGKILDALGRVGCMNPLILLDEIDKIGSDHRGDPASALLEVLDPEQNHTFTDHYFNLPFDLSKILFIVTANYLHDIPRPLLDRLEVIPIEGYTEQEKVAIAQQHLLPRVLTSHGLNDEPPTFEIPTLQSIIRQWTREAGVRNLQRSLEKVARKVARRRVERAEGAEGAGEAIEAVTPEGLPELLGPPRHVDDEGMEAPEVGVATGLAWTATGGEILLIEALQMPGKGKLAITGKLGDVMKESVQAAFSFVRSRAARLGIEEGIFEQVDLHVHFPAGAVPKDGPSAGVTVTVALASLLASRPVRPHVALTGEVTLRGKVLAVGGIKDKVLAAHRAGVTEVILPAANEKDLVDVPEEIRGAITFRPVRHIDEVLPLVLDEATGAVAAAS